MIVKSGTIVFRLFHCEKWQHLNSLVPLIIVGNGNFQYFSVGNFSRGKMFLKRNRSNLWSYLQVALSECHANCVLSQLPLKKQKFVHKSYRNANFTFMQTGQSQQNSPSDSSMIQQDCLTFLNSSKVEKLGEPLVLILFLASSTSGPGMVLLVDSTTHIWSTFREGQQDSSTVNLFFLSTFKICALPTLQDFHHWYPD